MAKYYTNTEELELIADAIREKGGTNAQLTFPNEFVSAIENLPTGGGTVTTGNNIIFYDYDGTIVTSYSASAFAQLSQLPANPTHAGLVAQGWNWSLNDAKTFVTAHPNDQLNIGQMYITESGATEIDIIMQEGRLEPILTICVKGTITVDWGDETTPDTVTGTSLDKRQAVPHTYAQAGAYTISISAEGNNQYSFFSSSTYTLLRKNTTDNENKVYANAIQHIRIGSNAKINTNAFYNCYSLSSITIPNSITSIGDCAFYNCYSLVSITIPSDITSITNSMFNSCISLSSIIIPNSITSIGGSAFSSCYSLSNVTIPDGITSIGNSAFNFCYSLPNITIPNGITSIGASTFYNCYSLSNITIPNSITSIGGNTFTGCSSLLNITIPNGVTSIGSGAFYNCCRFTNITIPYGVTSIQNTAFYRCFGLSSITIPNSVKSIGNSAFYYCHSLASIIIPNSVTSIGDSAFCYCSSLASITISNSVTSIENNAFTSCSSLVNVTIPDSVTSIGNSAFSNCYGMKEYHILPTTPPTAGTIVFNNIPSDCIIYVPKGHLTDYQTATNWSTYASYMQEEST